MEFKVYVIHVRGAIEREKHIKEELKKHSIEFDFILDGNISDITQLHIETYFSGDMKERKAVTSCGLKHFFAYEAMLRDEVDFALIFEDDIRLKPNFRNVFEQSINEIKKRNLKEVLISFENSNHMYVKKSELIPGQILYKKDFGRCAGAYLIDRAAAESILLEVYREKCNKAIDWYHNELSEKEKIHIYWTYPHVAEQASHNGTLPSLIDNKKTGYFRRFVYYMQKVFKS